jgi:2'-5' RNA ligase
VLNVPSPVADEIRELRSFLDPSRAKLAIEISLCGSNGRGIIAPGQPPEAVFAETDKIARRTHPFSARFDSIKRFPDTGIFYYTLTDPAPFEKLHKMFADSKINFLPTNFAYEPHCTIKLSSKFHYTEEQIIARLYPPQEEFVIDTISIYSLNLDKNIPRLLHRVNLQETS